MRDRCGRAASPPGVRGRQLSEAAGFAAGEVFTSQDGQVLVRYLRQEACEMRENP